MHFHNPNLNSNRTVTAPLLPLLLALFCVCITLAAEPTTSTLQPSELKKISKDHYHLGKIRINAAEKSLTFPVKVNMDQGVVEYALVHIGGKVHESIFSTDVPPKQLQLALLLISAKPFNAGKWPDDSAHILPPHALGIQLIQKTNGSDKITSLAEHLIYNDPNQTRSKKQSVETGNWLFNGSFTQGKDFVAERTGSMISIIADKEAIINGLREGFKNDLIHSANKKTLPRVGKRMEMKIILRISHSPKDHLTH